MQLKKKHINAIDFNERVKHVLNFSSIPLPKVTRLCYHTAFCWQPLIKIKEWNCSPCECNLFVLLVLQLKCMSACILREAEEEEADGPYFPRFWHFLKKEEYFNCCNRRLIKINFHRYMMIHRNTGNRITLGETIGPSKYIWDEVSTPWEPCAAPGHFCAPSCYNW